MPPMATNDDSRAEIAQVLREGLDSLKRIIGLPLLLVGKDGKVVMNPATGEPVEDVALKIQAITVMRQLINQLATLMDLWPAVKSQVVITSQDDAAGTGTEPS